jgi:hypothetical protein
MWIFQESSKKGGFEYGGARRGKPVNAGSIFGIPAAYQAIHALKYDAE